MSPNSNQIEREPTKPDVSHITDMQAKLMLKEYNIVKKNTDSVCYPTYATIGEQAVQSVLK